MAHTADHAADEAEHENHFTKVFIGVFVALTVFTLFCMLVARSLAPAPDPSQDSILRSQLLQRIEPVGKVNTSADQLDAPATVVTAADMIPKSPADLVAGNCAACHVAGVAGAPKSDDAAEWAKRRDLGLDALVASVINGKGNMPARAGTTLSDDEIRIAVQHLAGFEVDESAAAPAATDTASTDTASTGTDTVAAAAAGGAAIGGMTDSIKQVADSVCSGCHLTGVANAPKLGDKAAWAARAEKGLDGMVKVVVSGLNAMPARGGSALTDEEIGVAIQYLMSK